MAWVVDDSEQRSKYDKGGHVDVPSAAMSKYFEWKRRITSSGYGEDPKTAARHAGDMHFERVGDVYTIRLSQKHRVVFTINETRKQVKVLRVGGHYP